jgi:CDGSH-type Zn-finger protein
MKDGVASSRSARPKEVSMSAVKITALKNGPYKVEGPIGLFHDTIQVDITGKDTVFLCRCGASSKKPFCDSTHSKSGFQAAASIVPESKEE